MARARKVKLLLLISNDIYFDLWPKNYPLNGSPTTRIEHMSWTEVLSIARRAANDPGAHGKTEGWVLRELGRYLEHSGSGVVKLDNMGKYWNRACEGAAAGKLDPAAAKDVAPRIGQVFLHSTFGLSEFLGLDFKYDLLSESEYRARADALVAGEAFVGKLRARGGLEVEAGVHLASQRVHFSTVVKPEDPKAVNSRKVAQLLRRLPEVQRNLYIQACRTGVGTKPLSGSYLKDPEETRKILLPARNGPAIGSFRLTLDVPMSQHKATKGRRVGFAKTFERDLLTFYRLGIEPFRRGRRAAA